MVAAKIILVFFFGLVAAGDSTTTIDIIGLDLSTSISTLPNIAASIIDANPTATTFSMNCIEGNGCGVLSKQIQVIGPSTYRVDVENSNNYIHVTGRVECQISQSAVCTENWTGFRRNTGVLYRTYPADAIGTYGLLVTAGVEKLEAVGAKPTGTKSGDTRHCGGKTSNCTSKPIDSVEEPVTQTGSTGSPTQIYPLRPTGAASANTVDSGGLLSVAAAVLGGLLF